MTLLHMTVSGGLIILLTVIIRRIGAKRMPKSVIMTMWLIAVLRLLVPVSVPIPIPEAVLKHCGAISADNASSSAVKPDNVYTGIISNDEYTILPSVLPDSSQVTDNPGTTANTVQPTNRSALPKSLALAAWLAGVLPLAVVFTSNYILNMRRLKCAIPCRHPFVEEWQSRHKLKRNYTIGVSDMISSPLTYGTVKPVILLSKSAQAQNESSLSYILAHEYIHIKHFDVLFKIVLAAILCIHWFNPLVWVMYILANRDIELSCDEAVVKMFGESSKASYAYTLINLEAARTKQRYFVSDFNKNIIEERISEIMRTKKNNVFAIILAALLIFVGTVAAFAVPEEEKKAEADSTTSVTVLAEEDMNSIFGIELDNASKEPKAQNLQPSDYDKYISRFRTDKRPLMCCLTTNERMQYTLPFLDDYRELDMDENGVAHLTLSEASFFTFTGTVIITADDGEPFNYYFGKYDSPSLYVFRNKDGEFPENAKIGFIANGKKLEFSCDKQYDDDCINGTWITMPDEFNEDTQCYAYISCDTPIYIDGVDVNASSQVYRFSNYLMNDFYTSNGITYPNDGVDYGSRKLTKLSYAYLDEAPLESASDISIGNSVILRTSSNCLTQLKCGDKVHVKVNLNFDENDDVRWSLNLSDKTPSVLSDGEKTDSLVSLDSAHSRQSSADVVFEIPSDGDYLIEFVNDSKGALHIDSTSVEITRQ